LRIAAPETQTLRAHYGTNISRRTEVERAAFNQPVMAELLPEEKSISRRLSEAIYFAHLFV
jgi:hypothetical protein